MVFLFLVELYIISMFQGMGDFLNEMATMMSQNKSNVSCCFLLVFSIYIHWSFRVSEIWLKMGHCAMSLTVFFLVWSVVFVVLLDMKIFVINLSQSSGKRLGEGFWVDLGIWTWISSVRVELFLFFFFFVSDVKWRWIGFEDLPFLNHKQQAI